jgi:hypothetical protein
MCSFVQQTPGGGIEDAETPRETECFARFGIAPAYSSIVRQPNRHIYCNAPRAGIRIHQLKETREDMKLK